LFVVGCCSLIIVGFDSSLKALRHVERGSVVNVLDMGSVADVLDKSSVADVLDKGSVADFSEAHAAFVFSVQMSRIIPSPLPSKWVAPPVLHVGNPVSVHMVLRSESGSNIKYILGFRDSTSSCAKAGSTFRRPLQLHIHPVLNNTALFVHYLTW
jgi:hypothetical protein